MVFVRQKYNSVALLELLVPYFAVRCGHKMATPELAGVRKHEIDSEERAGIKVVTAHCSTTCFAVLVKLDTSRMDPFADASIHIRENTPVLAVNLSDKIAKLLVKLGCLLLPKPTFLKVQNRASSSPLNSLTNC
jgi:hypothetical protein